MDNEQGWQRLAAAVRARRDQRGWTQLDVATRGPLSIDRIQAIEGARTDRYSSRTLAKLENALEWATGSCGDILDGGDPTPKEVPAGAAEPRDPVAELTERLERLEQREARRQREDDELRRMFREITGKDPGSAGHAGREEPESDRPQQAM